MKVLIPVPLDIPKKAEITCFNCGAVLEVEPNDFQYHSDYYDNVWFSCLCGNCHKRINISYEKYPFKNKLNYVCRDSHS